MIACGRVFFFWGGIAPTANSLLAFGTNTDLDCLAWVCSGLVASNPNPLILSRVFAVAAVFGAVD